MARAEACHFNPELRESPFFRQKSAYPANELGKTAAVYRRFGRRHLCKSRRVSADISDQGSSGRGARSPA